MIHSCVVDILRHWIWVSPGEGLNKPLSDFTLSERNYIENGNSRTRNYLSNGRIFPLHFQCSHANMEQLHTSKGLLLFMQEIDFKKSIRNPKVSKRGINLWFWSQNFIIKRWNGSAANKRRCSALKSSSNSFCTQTFTVSLVLYCMLEYFGF